MARTWSVFAAVAILAATCANAQTPVGGAFTYQGQLKEQGEPATGAYAMQFKLYDAGSGGTLIATYPPSGTVAVSVQDGMFTTMLDFGLTPFDGERRWLEVVVESVTLAPRQELTATPYALYALNGPGGESFWQAGTGGAIYYNGGNVGIGADPTPNHLLEVAGDDVLISTPGGGNANLILNDTDGGTSPPGIAFWGNTQAGFYGPDTGDQTFAFRAGYPSPRVHDAHLRVYGPEDTQFIDLTHDGADAIISAAADDLVLNSTGTNSAGLVLNGGTIGDMAFYTGSFVPESERMRIDASGNVGIGTAAPARDLEVRKSVNGLVDAGVENDSAEANARAALAVGCDVTQGTFLAHSSTYENPAQRERVAVVAEVGAGGLSLAASDSDGDLRFHTGGFEASNERMRIDANGNVGIGISTPSARLNAYTVGGTGLMGQSGTGTGVYGVSGSSAGVMGYSIGGGAIGKLGDPSYGVYGENPGGIAGYFDGNAHVTGDLAVTGEIASDVGGFRFPDNSVQTTAGVTGSGTNGYLPKFTGTKSVGNSILYETAGGVIINGTSSTAALEIMTTAEETLLLDGPGVFDTNGRIRFQDMFGDVYIQNDGDGDLLMHLGETVGGRLAITGGNVGIGTLDPNNALSVAGDADFTGYVGIGTANPSAQLEVEGTDPWLVLDSTANQTGVSLKQNGATKWALVWAPGSQYLYFWRGSGGTSVVLSDATGNMGIGVTDPSEKLDTSGTARLRGIGTSTGTAVVADANGKLWKQTSSLRYKHNIADLPTAGDAVLDLCPVSFDWNSTDAPDIGLIAEEVEQVLPDLVIRDADGQPDGVRYDKVALYLLDVVRNQRGQIVQQGDQLAEQQANLAGQQDQISAQQAQLAAQGKVISTLQARLDKLEALFAEHGVLPTGGVR